MSCFGLGLCSGKPSVGESILTDVTAESADIAVAESAEQEPSFVQRIKVHDEAHLKELIGSDGIDLEKWGVGKAKSVKALFKEIEEGESFVERSAETGKLRRVVEPVFVQVIWRGKHVLVNTVQQLEDGRQRDRNMLLAEKRKPEDDGTLAGRADSVWDTAIRGISEELDIGVQKLLVPDVLRLREDDYNCSELHKDSFSYPGMPCVYRNHYLIVDILNTELALSTFSHCGLPDVKDFSTTEGADRGQRKNWWTWMSLEKAEKQKIKEFPPRQAEKLAEHQSSGFTRKLRINSVAELIAVLESEGVDISKFGEGQAKSVDALYQELCDQACHLERPLAAAAAVRRVVEPVIIQLRWREKVLVNTRQVLENGQTRERHMLLAKKKRPEDSGLKSKKGGGGVWDTAMRAITEELGIPAEVLSRPGVLYLTEQSHFCSGMSSLGFSYPGLYCLYRTHYVSIDILETPEGLSAFKACGLPDGANFDTLENHHVHGQRTNSWSWWPVERAIAQNVKEFPPATRALAMLEARKNAQKRVDIMSLDELESVLKDEGIDTSAFGVGNAKSIRAFYHELMEGSCILERPRDGGTLQRTVEPVFVELRYRDRVLFNTVQKLEDGRERERGMLLAEKKHPRDDGSLSKKDTYWDTALRGIAEELAVNIEQLLLPGALSFLEDMYATSTLVTDSFSYPGVKSCYRNHYVVATIPETDVAHKLFGNCGVPDLKSFESKENHRLGQRVNVWEWVDRNKAVEEFKKRMYPSTV